ncbi:MAG: hypothetical protein IKE09_04890 [Clostridiales bacterium]|nr:hypothetical protein [Clostridiales bacterium]
MTKNQFSDEPALVEHRAMWVLKTICEVDSPFDLWSARPKKQTLVSFVDAECAQDNTVNEKGVITTFVCHKCKKEFKAKKARGMFIYLNGSAFIQRAYCGRCLPERKVYELKRQIEDIIAKEINNG